jgi:hypothetical protein
MVRGPPSTTAGLRALTGVRRIGLRVRNPPPTILNQGEPTVKNRMQRAWQLAVAIAPIAAIALVEAAMRRW